MKKSNNPQEHHPRTRKLCSLPYRRPSYSWTGSQSLETDVFLRHRIVH